jgi:hypothetical protein
MMRRKLLGVVEIAETLGVSNLGRRELLFFTGGGAGGTGAFLVAVLLIGLMTAGVRFPAGQNDPLSSGDDLLPEGPIVPNPMALEDQLRS